MAKEIKVEWCENFIKSKFKKLPDFAYGFETNCFFMMAAETGLYTQGTYDSPMSQALEKLTTVETVQDTDGNDAFLAFLLKQYKPGYRQNGQNVESGHIIQCFSDELEYNVFKLNMNERR